MSRLSRRLFVLGAGAAGLGLLAGCGRLLTDGSLCRQQGRSLLLVGRGRRTPRNRSAIAPA